MRALGSGTDWTLRLCSGCLRRRMMPARNSSCLACEDDIPARRPARLQEVTALRALRRARGLTVLELARRAGVNPTTVCRLEERGETANPQRAQAKTAAKLARALGVGVAELAGERYGRAAA